MQAQASVPAQPPAMSEAEAMPSRLGSSRLESVSYDPKYKANDGVSRTTVMPIPRSGP